MAEVIIAQTHETFDVNVVEIHKSRRAYLEEKFNVRTFSNIGSDESKSVLFDNTDAIVLAVKPQNLQGVFDAAGSHVDPQTLLFSVMAGVTVDQLKKGFNAGHVCRTMPNTPAMIGKGITVWTVSNSVTEVQKGLIQELLKPMGEQAYVEDEEFVDMATAVSGSGPAYTFLFVEASIESAVHMGLPRSLAQKLVLQTMEGAIAYAKESNEHPAVLRNDITSPGGTTAAATYKLEEGRFRNVVSDAVWAAYQRARELGGKDHKVGPSTLR